MRILGEVLPVIGLGEIKRSSFNIPQQYNLACFGALPVSQYPPFRQKNAFGIHAV
jgi:hypothetical protein